MMQKLNRLFDVYFLNFFSGLIFYRQTSRIRVANFLSECVKLQAQSSMFIL